MTQLANIVLSLAQAAGGETTPDGAASPPSPGRPATLPTVDILIWLSVLLVAVIVGYLVAMYFRSRVAAAPTTGAKSTFTLAELRQMHAAGQLTDDEFARARDRVLQLSGYATPAEPPGAPAPAADTSQPVPSSPVASDRAETDLGPELLADPDADRPPNPGEIDADRAEDDSHNADEGESDRRID